MCVSACLFWLLCLSGLVRPPRVCSASFATGSGILAGRSALCASGTVRCSSVRRARVVMHAVAVCSQLSHI
jgi:hypothetical protein